MLDAWLRALPWITGPMVAVWGFSVLRRDASVVDVVWGPGFAVAAGVYFTGAPEPGLRSWLLLAAVILWAGRLALHLGVRWSGKDEEDYRYAAMREKHGRRFPLVSLFTVFLLQAGLIWVLSWPLLAGIREAGAPGILGWTGIAVFLVGLGVEAVADRQLSRFRADPENRGQVLARGLWRYSRHPNYFGEALLWWGFWLVAADAGGWWTLFAPVGMTVLLLRISGVPLLEPHLEETRPGYADYVRRTPAFVPWFPREGEG